MSGPPFHIKAKPGDIAEKAILVGDPGRVDVVAGLLSDTRVVNRHRGFYTVTGLYNGERITVATHGIGGASAAIVFEELGMLGAKVFVRLGTCGGFKPELTIGKVVVATSAAHYHGGTPGQYFPGICMANGSDPVLTARIMEYLERHGIEYFSGPVFSSDAFYAEDPEFARRWARMGVLAVEMECATLFTLSWLRGWRSACVLVVSDNLLEMEKEPRFATTEELREVFIRVTRAVLDALVSL